jgi:hypothetical protein
MNDVGYVVIAYVGAGLLYGLYALRLRARERSLERRNGGGAR